MKADSGKFTLDGKTEWAAGAYAFLTLMHSYPDGTPLVIDAAFKATLDNLLSYAPQDVSYIGTNWAWQHRTGRSQG